MEKIVVGLLGVLLGILINEYFRRNARIEKYSDKIFEKRLEIYENFSKEISTANSVITELTNAEELSVEDKKEIAFQAGLKVVEYADKYEFYLNEEIAIHCGMVFVATSDIFEDGINKESLADFRQGIRDAKLMIRSEAGLSEMDNFFKSVTKSTPGGKLIEGYRVIKKQHAKGKA